MHRVCVRARMHDYSNLRLSYNLQCSTETNASGHIAYTGQLEGVGGGVGDSGGGGGRASFTGHTAV